MMVKRKKYFFSSSEASDFWGRLRNDFCTHPDSVSYIKQATHMVAVHCIWETLHTARDHICVLLAD